MLALTASPRRELEHAMKSRLLKNVGTVTMLGALLTAGCGTTATGAPDISVITLIMGAVIWTVLQAFTTP